MARSNKTVCTPELLEAIPSLRIVSLTLINDGGHNVCHPLIQGTPHCLELMDEIVSGPNEDIERPDPQLLTRPWQEKLMKLACHVAIVLRYGEVTQCEQGGLTVTVGWQPSDAAEKASSFINNLTASRWG